MNGILIVGHGPLPDAMAASLQMIVGKQDNIHTVSLKPEESKEDLETKMSKIGEQMTDYEHVDVFADLVGGSPANAAVTTFYGNKKYSIIAGMNLPMLLSAAMLPGAETGTLLTEARNSIQVLSETEEKPLEEKADAQKDASEKAALAGPHEVCNVRVDSRGIHGQVATAWAPTLKVDRIVVVDDLAIKDPIQKKALRMACPANVKLSVLSAAKAVERLSEKNSYPGERLLVVFERISTLHQVAELGHHFEEVNLGNIPTRPGTKAYRKTISLLPEEVDVLKELIGKGTVITAQMVPNDKKENFAAYIE